MWMNSNSEFVPVKFRSHEVPGSVLYLMARTRMGPTERCWSSPLSKGSHGYHQAWDGVTVRLLHVMWYERLFGVVAGRGKRGDDMVLDHVCRNKGCVNPYHLRVITNNENKEPRPVQSACSTCGTPYAKRDNRGFPVCAPCKRVTYRRWADKQGRVPRVYKDKGET